VSSEIVPRIELSTIARNLGARASAARGPAIVGAGLLGTTRPEAVDLPALTPAAFAQDDREDEESGIMTLHFSAAELRGDAASPPLSDGARSVLHHVASVRHNGKHAKDHIEQLLGHANELGDLLGVPDADDDTTPTKAPLSLAERLNAAARDLNIMARNHRAAEVILSTYKPTTFSAFDATAHPDRAGSLADLFNTDLYALLEQEGGDHSDPAVRRKAAVELLAQWKSRPASSSAPAAPSLADQLDSADYERAITGFARNVQPLPHAEGALPPVDAGSNIEAKFRTAVEQTMAMHGWAVENVQLRRQAAREVLTAWEREPGDTQLGPADNLASLVTDAIYAAVVMGGSPSAGPASYDVKEKGMAQMSESKRYDDAPLYGRAAMQADELGGAARVTRLKAIAGELHLNLGRKQDHATALRILCSEMGDGAGELLVFGEHGATPEPPEYGRPRVQPTRGVPQDEDVRATCMAEAAAAELRKIPVDEEGRVGIAWRRAAAKFADTLAPTYGWPRQRRARG